MPIYEYQCLACGHHIEYIESVSAMPQSLCPACNANDLKRLVSSPNVQFKGSGWYITDYKKTNNAEGNVATKPTTEAKAMPKAATKAETKASSADS